MIYTYRNNWNIKFSASNHTQSFVHDKSSSTSQFIGYKSRNLQTLLRYLSGIVTSTFKAGTVESSGCGGSDPSSFGGICGGCGGLRVGLPTIFVLYLNDLPSETLSSTSSVSSL